jgi:hypothetical protein
MIWDFLNFSLPLPSSLSCHCVNVKFYLFCHWCVLDKLLLMYFATWVNFSTNYSIQWVGGSKDWCAFQWCVVFCLKHLTAKLRRTIEIETFTYACKCFIIPKEKKSSCRSVTRWKKSFSFKPLPSSFVLHATNINCFEMAPLYVLKLQKRVFSLY